MNRQEMIDLAKQIRSDEERPQVTPPHPPQATTTTIQVPTSVGDVRVLCHSPIDAVEPLPGFISFHGGGFITGTPEMDEPWNLFLAETVNCHVLNIEYPLAPEHPFPVPVHVAYEVVQWIFQHADTLRLDASRIAIGGHSAGGNLATAYRYGTLSRQILFRSSLKFWTILRLISRRIPRINHSSRKRSPLNRHGSSMRCTSLVRKTRIITSLRHSMRLNSMRYHRRSS